MAAVSCVFFPFSPASFVAGLINTIGTVAIHAALRASMDKVGRKTNTGIVPYTNSATRLDRYRAVCYQKV
jgi:hypothetical protein